MEKADKININNFETLNSMVTRLEAVVLNLKGKYSFLSAASTVATSSSGSGGSHTGLLAPGAPSEWVPTRIELKGWGVWRKIRETGITMDEAKDLVDRMKALTSSIHHDKFDWDMIAKNQGFFEIKWQSFLWFKEDVTLRDRRLAQMDIGQALLISLVEVRGVKIRATLEDDPAKRPWQKATAIYFTTMKKYANLGAETLDVKWVTMGVRVEVNCTPGGVLPTMSQLASFNIWSIWKINEDVLKKIAPAISHSGLQDRFEDS